MPRRTKKEKKSVFSKNIGSGKGKVFPGTSSRSFKARKATRKDKNFRFSIFLIILTAVLEISLLMLLLSLVSAQKIEKVGGSFAATTASSGGNRTIPSSQELNDPAIDFQLSIPSQLGDWKYRIGYVKSLVDETILNQYLRIYLPKSSGKNSRNFDEINEDFLTIRKFGSEEWEEIQEGCEKGNLIFCEAAGEKMAEKSGSVYAYTKVNSCSSGKAGDECRFLEKIIGSFRLK